MATKALDGAYEVLMRLLGEYEAAMSAARGKHHSSRAKQGWREARAKAIGACLVVRRMESEEGGDNGALLEQLMKAARLFILE